MHRYWRRHVYRFARRRSSHVRERRHGFCFDIFLTKMFFRCFLKCFYFAMELEGGAAADQRRLWFQIIKRQSSFSRIFNQQQGYLLYGVLHANPSPFFSFSSSLYPSSASSTINSCLVYISSNFRAVTNCCYRLAKN